MSEGDKWTCDCGSRAFAGRSIVQDCRLTLTFWALIECLLCNKRWIWNNSDGRCIVASYENCKRVHDEVNGVA